MTIAIGRPRSETCEVLGHGIFDFFRYYGQKNTPLIGSTHALSKIYSNAMYYALS